MRIDTQKQTLQARDESIKKLLEMLQSKGEGKKYRQRMKGVENLYELRRKSLCWRRGKHVKEKKKVMGNNILHQALFTFEDIWQTIWSIIWWGGWYFFKVGLQEKWNKTLLLKKDNVKRQFILNHVFLGSK